MKIAMLNRRGALAAAIAFALSPAPAMAQQKAALDEIIVTARRTTESLQEAPISVSAFTREAIAEKGIVDINSLAQFTPGLSFSKAFGRSVDRPVIRGQSNILAGVQFGVESGTAYFIDGVYFNGDIQSLDFDSLERVEVIKGPQSALYGRNTYAGAINFVTRDPGEKFEGSAKVSMGSHETRDATASVSGPLTENLSMRLSGRYHEYGGEYTNSLTHEKVGSEQDNSFSATLVYEPTDNFKARLFAVVRNQDDGPLALFLQGAEYNNCRPGYRSAGYRGISLTTGLPTTLPSFGQRAPISNVNQFYCGVIQARPGLIALNTDPLAASGSTPAFADGTAFDGVEADDFFTSLGLTWDVGGTGWTLTSLSGYRDKQDLFGTDSDHSGAFIGAVTSVQSSEPLFANTNRNATREYSSELKLSSPSGNRLRGMLGVYYYDNQDDETDLTYAKPRLGVYNANANNTSINNKAVFGGLSFDVTDALTAGVELRYAKEEKERTEYISAATNPNSTNGTPRPTLKAEYSATTPRLTVDYKLNDDVMLYGILSQGAKPGGINGAAGAALGKPTYDQEKSDNVELGMKSSWLDDRVRFNIAGYYTKAEDVQVTQAIPTAGTAVTSIAVNAGSAEIKGLELELSGVLGAGFGAQATFAYTDAKFTEGCDDFEYVLNSGGYVYPAALASDPAVQALCSIDGRRLPLVPETQGSLTLTYDRELGSQWALFGSATGTYEGSKYVQVHNLAETGDATELGLRLGIRNEHVSLALYGRNVTDEDTIAMATRWFDLRYGSGRRGLAGTAPASTPPLTTPASFGADTGSPRALFAALRKGAEFGFEFRYQF